KSGAGDFLINLARCAVGRFIGGPGLVAVFGSALMGSISGSAVANTVSTGVITIPMMKRSGFSARFAASVEAAASTGGQLMPPIMGAGAFIMATYTQISYMHIIAVALLPALLYFLSMMFFVRIEARKLNIVVHEDDIPKFAEVMKEGGHLIIPIAVLVGLLMYGFTPTYAAGLSILSVIGATWLSSKPMGLMDVLDALSLGARNMTSTAILLIGVGIVVSVVSTTGVGNVFSIMISDWAGGSLMITIILVALASLVLGMGLPVTAAYIVLGTLSAPAIYQLIVEARLVDAIASGQMTDMVRGIIMLVAPEQAANLGQPMSAEAALALIQLIPASMLAMVQEQILPPAVLTTALLSAHMIIFWLSQDSNVTPPVCLTVFAAAAIAGSKPMETGLTAWKIAKGIYIIPLLFAYTPFLNGDWFLALEIFAWAALGIYALAGSFQGYLEGPVSWRLRPLLVLIGGVLLWPEMDYLLRGGALLLLLVIFFISREPIAKPLVQ
ncbi:MAG: TRAP transporter fused permease subunit, partial [Gammaproteobacteria bacterium]|nr:TRAP transporter fused permease subunit [Gammaproteobacteria bacterium]